VTLISKIVLPTLVVLAIACSVMKYGEESARFDKKAPSVVATRTVTSNHGEDITLVRASINGEELGWFMLVSGSAYSVIDSKFVPRTKGLSKQIETEIPYPCKLPVTVYHAKSLTVGPLTIKNFDLVSFDLSGVSQDIDEEVVGMLGFSVFAKSVVKIEYGRDGNDDRVSIFSPNSFELSEGEWQPLGTVAFQPAMTGRVNRKHTAPFVIDTGYSGGVSFYSVFAANHDILEGRPTSEKPSYTLCGVATELEGTVRVFEIGSNTYDELPVSILQPGSITDVAPGRIGGIVGRGMLVNYDVVFDVQNQRIAFLE
jgi:hypothetical protein